MPSWCHCSLVFSCFTDSSFSSLCLSSSKTRSAVKSCRGHPSYIFSRRSKRRGMEKREKSNEKKVEKLRSPATNLCLCWNLPAPISLPCLVVEEQEPWVTSPGQCVDMLLRFGERFLELPWAAARPWSSHTILSNDIVSFSVWHLQILASRLGPAVASGSRRKRLITPDDRWRTFAIRRFERPSAWYATIFLFSTSRNPLTLPITSAQKISLSDYAQINFYHWRNQKIKTIGCGK